MANRPVSALVTYSMAPVVTGSPMDDIQTTGYYSCLYGWGTWGAFAPPSFPGAHAHGEDGMTPLQFKKARLSLCLSQRDLADLLELGIHGERTVRRWEEGERDIPGPVILVMELCTEIQAVRDHLDIDFKPVD